ncbi:hypothetical protein M5D96_003390 [Drosophila gunungcola]|uniref:Uncharacterized protein n=1 Tax=Drosophila gunungcola TaxID=103775 RepID=A0A9P9YSI4_9MUSC|nr:hypothetical protein M5D96_003390 [Drosophila gunungcola]
MRSHAYFNHHNNIINAADKPLKTLAESTSCRPEYIGHKTHLASIELARARPKQNGK